jgi:hypothetical protein
VFSIEITNTTIARPANERRPIWAKLDLKAPAMPLSGRATADVETASAPATLKVAAGGDERLQRVETSLPKDA